MITGIYAAFFAIIQMVMVVWIARARWRDKVSLGDGDSDDVQRRSRVYGNYIETVWPAVILMALAEFGGAPYWILHWMGLLMILGRICHACGLLTGPGYGPYRMAGMLMTMAVFLIGAGLCMVLAL